MAESIIAHGKDIEGYRKLKKKLREDIIPEERDGRYIMSKLRWVQRAKLEKRFFDNVIVDGLENLQKVEGQKIYLMNHRSLWDFIEFGKIILEQGLPLPRIAAGKNLYFWPLKAALNFPKMGAFLVDRDLFLRGDPFRTRIGGRVLYSVTREFLDKGEDIGVFPEGTRVEGEPYSIYKEGFLRMFAAWNGDAWIIPVDFHYDNRIENGFFSALNLFRPRRNFLQRFLYYSTDALAYSLRYLTRGFGNAGNCYVRFLQPEKLCDITGQGNLEQRTQNLINFFLKTGKKNQ